MKISMTSLALAAMMTAAASAAQAAEIGYSAAQPLADRTAWGTGKAETYDVSILVPGSVFDGSRVVSLALAMPGDVTLDSPKGWLSSRLVVDGTKFTPDIQSVNAEWDGTQLTATFADIETVASDGVYVGFTFTLPDIETDGDRQPLLIANGETGEGLWVHTSRTYRNWVERSSNLGKSSVLTVTLDGDFAQASAAIIPSDGFGTAGSTINVPVTLVTYGTDPVASFACEGTFDDGTQVTGSFEFASAVPALYGAAAPAMVSIEAPQTCGSKMLTLNVTEVNGQPNAKTDGEGTALIDVVAFVPRHRPLMEEYTGTWCGYCPRGFIAMERMNKMYGDDFVCLSYHDTFGHPTPDPMQAFRSFPTEVESFPKAVFDRTFMCDPYYGKDYDHGFAIPGLYDELSAEFTPAEIEADIAWDGTMESEIEVTARIRFAKSFDSVSYRVAYVLAADGMTGPSDPLDPQFGGWLQQNNFCDRDEFVGQGDDWDVFNYGKQKVSGLVFNDVAVAASNFNGIPGSLPAVIEVGEEYTHSFTFNPSEIKNVSGYLMLAEGMSLHCVAMVIDTAYHNVVVNSVRTGDVGYVSGIDDTVAEPCVVSTEWHDLTGARVADRASGLLLRTVTLSDGTRRTDKVMVR